MQYTTSAQSLLSGNCSGITTVKTYNPSGILTNVGSNLTVSLSGPGSVTFYSDSICSTSISQVTISSGTNAANFYFIDTSASSIDLTASAPSFKAAIQSETIAANPYVWTGGGANANWSTAENWSGGAAPGAGNIALFDNTCLSNCSPSITANISIAGQRMSSGYTGTITQNAGITITIGASGWTQLAGTFAGGNSTMTLNGNFNLAGGTFTNTSGTFLNKFNWSISGAPTFNHGSGTIQFYNVWTNSARSITPGSSVFNNVTFNGDRGSYTLTGTMTVDGTLLIADTNGFDPGAINGGIILAKGDLNFTNLGIYGTCLIKVAGSSNQAVNGTTTARIPNFEIASTGGTVSYSTNLLFFGNYTYTSGTVNLASSTLSFATVLTGTSTITPGAITYNNVTLAGDRSNFNLVGTMTVNGNLTLSDANGIAGNLSGTILALGNVNFSGTGKNGSGLIKIAGSVNQTLTGVSTANIPNFEIASAGGTVTLSGTFFEVRNYTYTSGTVDASNSSFVFYNSVSTQTIIPGSVVYNNVTFNGNRATYNITGTMTVNGTLSIADVNSIPGSITGALVANGNVIFSSYGEGGTAALTLGGSTNTTLTIGASAARISGAVTVNKTGGAVVTMASNVAFNAAGQDLTITAGTLDMAGYNLTIGRNISNGDILKRGNSPTCGTVSQGGSYSGAAAICP